VHLWPQARPHPGSRPRDGPTRTWSRDEAEWGKVISTALKDGHPVNFFDNVTGLVDSAALASVLTSATIKPRLLGKNEMPDLLNRAVWMMTRNNLRLSADIARRTVRVRLDAKMAQPWTRPYTGFKHADLLEWVTQERPHLLHALLTIARAWYARGKPAAVVPTLGNYNEWARTIGGMLALARVEGFLSNLDQLWEEADNSATEWEPFLYAWHEAYGDQPVRASRVYDDVCDRYNNLSGTHECWNAGLRDALPSALAGLRRDGGAFARELGKALKTQIGARRGEEQYRVVFAGKDRSKIALWKVERD
jgi:hypothetical protein